jgi:hypothetical protein
MLASRLFHSVIIVGAALVAGAGIGCSAGGGTAGIPSTGSTGSDTRATDPAPDEDAGAASDDGGGGPGADAATDPGWAPTK